MKLVDPQTPSSEVRSRRMRVLSVVSSSNQLYSGIGRNIFEIARRLNDRVEFTFAIDDGTLRNTDLMVAFGRELGITVHVGRARQCDDTLDLSNDDLPGLLARNRWDAVECVSWANAGTNRVVLEHLPPQLPLAYTPHDQPTWTVPMPRVHEAKTLDTHQWAVGRANVVLCVSPHERDVVQKLAPRRLNCAFLPNGCEFDRFAQLDAPRPPSLLFVGDLVEPRKRFDRVAKVFERLLESRPDLQLLVVGNRPDHRAELVPESIRHAVRLLGYLDDDGLIASYRDALGLFLLSEYEAFGIPILEALASATPVFITPMDTTKSLFRPYHGVYFCPPDDPDQTAATVLDVLSCRDRLECQMIAQLPRLRAMFDWDIIAERKWVLLRSAWFRARGFAVSA